MIASNRLYSVLVLVVVAAASIKPPARADMITSVASDPLLKGAIGVTTDGVRVFATTSFNQRVLSVPIGGGAVTALYSNLVSPLGTTTLGSNVFWIDPNSGPFTDPQILRAPKTGGTPPVAIYTGSNLPSPHGVLDGSGLTTDGTRLYWSDEVGGFVFAINPDGTGVTQLGPQRYTGGFSTEHLNTIAYADGMLYVADSGKAGVTSPSVLAIPTTGGTFSTLFSGSPLVQPRGITVGDGSIFVTDQNKIWQLPLTGGTPTVRVTDTRFSDLQNLAYFDHALYVADAGAPTSTSGTIWRVDLAAVPEPSGFALYGCGLLLGGGVAFARRWRARHG